MVTIAQSTMNWCNTHSHMDHTHSLTHFASTQLQPHGVKCQLSYYFSVHAGSVHVSIIHQTLIWTTGSLTCRHDHFCACVYTRGLGTPTVGLHNIFDWEKKSLCVLLSHLTGFKPS